MQLIEYVRSQLDQLSYDKETGIAYGSVRLAARMAGVDGQAIRTALKGAEPAATKLAEYLTSQGFQGAELDTKRGLSADVITAICTYYALKAGRYCNDTAGESLAMFAQIGLAVAIKQSIGVAVDDRPAPTPAVAPDMTMVMQMLMNQQAQIQQLLNQQQDAPVIVSHMAAPRSGRGAVARGLRCEDASVKKAFHHDPEFCREHDAITKALIKAERLKEAEEKGATQYINVEGNLLETGEFYKNEMIYRVLPLLDDELVTGMSWKQQDAQGLRPLSRKSQIDMYRALDRVLYGVPLHRLVNADSIIRGIFTAHALKHITAAKYKITMSVGHYLLDKGWERVANKRYSHRGVETYALYRRLANTKAEALEIINARK